MERVWRHALHSEMRQLSACRKVREGTRAARTMNWRGAPLEPVARQKCWKLARKLSLLVRCRRTRDGDAANGGAARVQRAVQAAAPTKARPTSPALCGARRHHHWRPRCLPGCVQRGWVLPAFKIYLWFFIRIINFVTCINCFFLFQWFWISVFLRPAKNYLVQNTILLIC